MGKYVGKNALTAFWNGIKAMFSDVAFSGDYDDLDSKPSVKTAASGGTTESLVTTGEKYDWNGKASVQELTKAQYEALSEVQKNNGTIYMITDDDGGWEAERSIYDNSDSGLSATNVQDAIDEVNAKKIVKYNSPLTSGYLACNNAVNQRIQIGVTSASGHYIGIIGDGGVNLYDATNGVSKGIARFDPLKTLTATSASITLTANTCQVVDYQFEVPEGYTIVSANDSSYFAGLIASPIRIFARDPSTGKQKVTFNYLSPNGAGARTYSAHAFAVKL